MKRERAAAAPIALSDQLLADGARCWECPLGRAGRPGRPVAAHVPMGATIAVVGEAPGRRELQHGAPFVGPSGRVLDEACAKAGVKRRALAVFNAASCGLLVSGDDDRKRAAVAACRPRLLSELRRMRPRVVLALGSHALRSLGDESLPGVTTVRGALIPFAEDVALLQADLLSSFHPAHVMRGGDGDQGEAPSDAGQSVDVLFFFLVYDIAKAQALASGEDVRWRDNVDSFADVASAALCKFALRMKIFDSSARRAGGFAIDIETDGKDSLSAAITSIAVATPVSAVAATWEVWQRAPLALAILRALLADRTVRPTFHYGIFDRPALARHGLPVTASCDDTFLQHHAVFPGLPHNLQQVATQFFVVPPWKAEFRRGERDTASLLLYNGRDALATARLQRALAKLVDSDGVGKVYEADRQQFSIEVRMREVGYWVDPIERARQSAVQHARLDAMVLGLADDFQAIEEPWRDAWARYSAQRQRQHDPPSYVERVKIRWAECAQRPRGAGQIGLFKPKAKADLVALFEVLRIPFTAYTERGAPVTNKDSLERASARHPLMRRLLHLRAAQHVLATYIDGLPLLADGRVHPEWSPKITGRRGAGKAQNWPKYVDGWPPEVDAAGEWKRRPSGDYVCPRENPRAIVAAPPGRMLVGGDWSQLELRIVMLLADDEWLRSIFSRGLDPHAEFAEVCFGAKFSGAARNFEELAAARGLKLKIKSKVEDILACDASDADRRTLATAAALWQRLRDLTKRAEYCGIYGGTAETVYDSIVKDFPEVTLDGLARIVDAINNKMTGVVRWRQEQEVKARVNRRIVEPLLGRQRLFPLGNFNPNVVYNFPVQAFGASLWTRAAFRFVALTRPTLLQLPALYQAKLLSPAWVMAQRSARLHIWRGVAPDILINGHDSITAECDERDVAQCETLLRAAMEQTVDGVSFPADVSSARRWSDT